MISIVCGEHLRGAITVKSVQKGVVDLTKKG